MRSVLKDVSIQEFQTLRDDEGLSNLEIAQRVGVSYNTVLKILGPQPKGIRKPRHYYSRVSSSKSLRLVKDEDPKEAALVFIDRPLIMGGLVGIYEIHPARDKFDIEINNQWIKGIELESIDIMITELERIRDNYKDIQKGELTVW